ncbi:hypothetical protein FACS189472_06210 [Alphaproteobacteria bacterium]|nr:hypothetical protein FACS189472_06210 [Alphaproteobacteria bacterium]
MLGLSVGQKVRESEYLLHPLLIALFCLQNSFIDSKISRIADSLTLLFGSWFLSFFDVWCVFAAV